MNTLTLQLPDNIPQPQFELFQPVQWEDYHETEAGHVIGRYFIDNNTALMEDRVAPGWHYMVSRIYGVTDVEQLVDANPELEMLPECCGTALVEVAA